MIDYLGCRFIPARRLEVDVGSKVDVSLVKLGFNLDEGCALSIELVFPIVDKAVTYFLHGIFVGKGRKW